MIKSMEATKQRHAQRFGICALIICIAIATYTMYDVASQTERQPLIAQTTSPLNIKELAQIIENDGLPEPIAEKAGMYSEYATYTHVNVRAKRMIVEKNGSQFHRWTYVADGVFNVCGKPQRTFKNIIITTKYLAKDEPKPL